MIGQANPSKVSTARHGDVLAIVINNPPINEGSIEVRRGLLEAVQQLDGDATLVAGVIVGAGETFIAGSDLREFGMPLEDPQLKWLRKLSGPGFKLGDSTFLA
ncbi:hypothetical protein GCM10023165_16170 [Variovorax defluvii]|uniref:Enoyl-CoA hydratase/isomerase family protein n=1 Tax=Variovorax defluvii TaxID=913761 RepID=A0ABP8HDN0_9BURK